MTLRCLILGGFEPSGHDSTADALLEEGVARGHIVDSLRWRDVVDLADHPMFTSHRYAAAHGIPDVAGLLDEDWIAEALSDDLGGYINTGYDAFLSVHPWSSMICAHALSRTQAKGLLVDYHCDFGAFPIVTHDRIDAYCGGGRVRALRPRIRSRCHIVGASVPRRFHEESPLESRPDTLVVSAGSDGWAIGAMLPAVHSLSQKLAPSRVVLLAPSETSQQHWQDAKIPRSEIVANSRDISRILKSARWYLCKGSGVAIAEGLAAGCRTFVSSSGIFWEEDVAELLKGRGIVADPSLAGDAIFIEANITNMSKQCRLSAELVWNLVEHGAPPKHQPLEEKMLAELLKQAASEGTDILPRTRAALEAGLEKWRAEWREITS